MKRCFCALLMVLSLLIGFQQAIIILHFRLNQDTVEQQFCVNKSRPELQCEGTCYLKKQLQGTGSRDPASISIYQRVYMLAISIIKFEASNPTIDIRRSISIYKEIRYIEPYREILVPPPVV